MNELSHGNPQGSTVCTACYFDVWDYCSHVWLSLSESSSRWLRIIEWPLAGTKWIWRCMPCVHHPQVIVLAATMELYTPVQRNMRSREPGGAADGCPFAHRFVYARRASKMESWRRAGARALVSLCTGCCSVCCTPAPRPSQSEEDIDRTMEIV